MRFSSLEMSFIFLFHPLSSLTHPPIQAIFSTQHLSFTAITFINPSLSPADRWRVICHTDLLRDNKHTFNRNATGHFFHTKVMCFKVPWHPNKSCYVSPNLGKYFIYHNSFFVSVPWHRAFMVHGTTDETDWMKPQMMKRCTIVLKDRPFKLWHYLSYPFQCFLLMTQHCSVAI